MGFSMNRMVQAVTLLRDFRGPLSPAKHHMVVWLACVGSTLGLPLKFPARKHFATCAGISLQMAAMSANDCDCRLGSVRYNVAILRTFVADMLPCANAWLQRVPAPLAVCRPPLHI